MTKTEAARRKHQSRPGRSSRFVPPHVRLAIYLRDKFLCQYCGRDMHDAQGWELTLDHLVPRSKAVENEDGRLVLSRSGKSIHHHTNLVTACHTCNCRRRDVAWRQYATAGAVERITRNIRKRLNLELAIRVQNGDTNPVEARQL